MTSIRETRVCPLCGQTYDEPPALSRVDNTTEICFECSMNEALEAAIQYLSSKKENDADED